jgi:hypothetical protein
VFNVRHLSDAAREIAKRIGYPPSRIFIEDTDDSVTSIVIPAGLNYSDFMLDKKDEYGWVFKADEKEFRFHPEHWAKERRQVKAIFNYGAGRDILSMTIDADFRLPLPNKVEAVSYSVLHRGMSVGTAVSERTALADPMASFNVLDDTKRVRLPSGAGSSRSKYLRRDAERFITAAGTTGRASVKAQKRFIDRNMRAMELTVQITGNPHIYGGDIVGITGTGSKLVDHNWYVSTAKHIFSGMTYVTELKLNTPPKTAGGILVLHRGHTVDKSGANRGLSSQVSTNHLADEPILAVLRKGVAFQNTRRGKK